MCTMCAPGALRGQKRALDSQELEIKTFVGAANPSWIFCKSNKCSKSLSRISRACITRVLKDIIK